MYPSVVKVSPGKDYVLSIVFDNGESGTLDMKQFLDFGVFKRLKNYEIFKTVRVSFDTIEWDTGIDLDPEKNVKKSHNKSLERDWAKPWRF